MVGRSEFGNAPIARLSERIFNVLSQTGYQFCRDPSYKSYKYKLRMNSRLLVLPILRVCVPNNSQKSLRRRGGNAAFAMNILERSMFESEVESYREIVYNCAPSLFRKMRTCRDRKANLSAEVGGVFLSKVGPFFRQIILGKNR